MQHICCHCFQDCRLLPRFSVTQQIMLVEAILGGGGLEGRAEIRLDQFSSAHFL